MKRVLQTVIFVVLVFAVATLTITDQCVAQEKLRIDTETVAVQSSPWKEIEVSTKSNLHGLHVTGKNVIWACGDDGAILQSNNGGVSWKSCKVEDPDYPDGPLLVDIHGFDDATAIAISAEVPAKIYRTTSGGLRWKTMLEYPGDNVFFRSLSFWDDHRGVVMGNAIDGRMLLLRTSDGGVVWKRLKADHRPPMNPGETAMVGNGSNMESKGNQMLVVGLGGAEVGSRDNSRVLVSTDFCHTWVSGSVPVRRSETGGIFSVHFTTEKDGVVIGGDEKNPEATDRVYAVTSDGGTTWGVPSPAIPPSGFRSCVAQYVDGNEIKLVAVGPTGTDLSTDLGNKWRRVSDKGFRVVSFAPEGKTGFGVGDDGLIARWLPDAVKSKNTSAQPTKQAAAK